MNHRNLIKADPEIFQAIKEETKREANKLELIASENFASEAVLEAQGSVMTNKYAEGYPRRRYYGGCEFVDRAEELAIERAKKLFGAEHANVQPHSGSQANMAVYFAALKFGDTVLGMDLSHGGHLTHGSPVNFSGKFYKFIPYGVDKKNEQIDFDSLGRLASEHKPKMIVVGASAYSRILDFKAFRKIADSVGAMVMADIAHIAGLIAAGLHPNPVLHAEFVTTTTHKTLRGPRGGIILCQEKYAKAINKMIFPGIQGGPLMHTIAAKAVAFQEALSPEFKGYQQQVLKNAAGLAEQMKKNGFRLVSGGTDNHLFLIDLTPQDLTGKDAEAALDRAGIIVNKNTIPFETRSPFVTSGLRIGTPALTTRGMKEKEMRRIADWIGAVLKDLRNEVLIGQIKDEVKKLCQKFPLYEKRLR